MMSQETTKKTHQIRRLRDVPDAVAFVDFLVKHVQPGTDLLDLLETVEYHWKVSFGPWRDVKDINGTLRTYGLWEDREGSKAASLIHPLGNRANTVIQVNELFDVIPLPEVLEYLRLPQEVLAKINNDTELKDLIEALPPSCIIARLIVEVKLINIFLKKHPEWLQRVFADYPPEQREQRIEKLTRLKDMSVRAIQEVLFKLIREGRAFNAVRHTAMPAQA
jgi:hypothetical protein